MWSGCNLIHSLVLYGWWNTFVLLMKFRAWTVSFSQMGIHLLLTCFYARFNAQFSKNWTTSNTKKIKSCLAVISQHLSDINNKNRYLYLQNCVCLNLFRIGLVKLKQLTKNQTVCHGKRVLISWFFVQSRILTYIKVSLLTIYQIFMRFFRFCLYNVFHCKSNSHEDFILVQNAS